MARPEIDPVEVRALLRKSALELRELAHHRRRLADTARADWRGARRRAFDDALAGIDAETARLCDLLDTLARRADGFEPPATGGAAR